MDNFINATLKAGNKIAKILQNKDAFLYQQHNRGVGGDISIGADLVSEKIFCEYLGEFGNIDSEESGFIDNKKDDVIIIDPLDGSDNFLSNIPYYGASVALCDKDLNTKIGIIMNFCDCSVIISNGKENFRGNLNNNFIDFRIINNINYSKCGIFEKAYSNPQICNIFRDNNIKFRSLGALALSLGLANDVNFVLFVGNIRKYDIKAGFLIAKNLYKMENKNFVLISKDKELFDNILKLVF
ncbi:hypothetical protein CCY99_05725 [Helicobacter sp. 16-1353]|uniref:inositol monophosphatase family protein n=1 Tax=Helicobacter sp. 16-1353 TaxID=2004996 RepID=UPI000DCE9CB9|nr:inositol monophosphatase family protein [Helicobacter sp. 16-1353]RAX53879.1 hypothetical protein CCY99_05725 [Helicobacter sp. 16-1353]